MSGIEHFPPTETSKGLSNKPIDTFWRFRAVFMGEEEREGFMVINLESQLDFLVMASKRKNKISIENLLKSYFKYEFSYVEFLCIFSNHKRSENFSDWIKDKTFLAKFNLFID